MKALLLKDIFCLRNQFKVLILIFVFYGFLGFSTGNYTFLSAFVPFIFTMMVLTSFSYDDIAKWPGYALSLPFSRSQIVLSKYLLALVLSIPAVLASLGYGYFMLFITKKPFTGEIMTTVFIASGLCFIFINILLPLVFYYGVEKSRTIMFLLFAIPFILVVIVEKSGLLERFQLTQISDADFLKALSFVGIPVLLLSAAISIPLSIQIVKRKEY